MTAVLYECTDCHKQGPDPDGSTERQPWVVCTDWPACDGKAIDPAIVRSWGFGQCHIGKKCEPVQ